MLTKMMVIEIDDIYYNINSSKNVMHAFEYFMLSGSEYFGNIKYLNLLGCWELEVGTDRLRLYA